MDTSANNITLTAWLANTVMPITITTGFLNEMHSIHPFTSFLTYLPAIGLTDNSV